MSFWEVRAVSRGAQVVAVCGLVVALAGCGGDEIAPEDAPVAYDVADGSGTVRSPSGERWTWRACGGCEPIAVAETVKTGSVSEATVFVATAPDGAKAASPTWRGNLSPATPPRLRGRLRANGLVQAIPGTWHGGWDRSGNDIELAACWAADGTGCTTLTDDHYPGCRGRGAVIDPVFTGRYLRIAIRRRPPGEARTLYLASSPYQSQVMPEGPTIAVAVVGRIAAATGPRKATCGPPPIPCPPEAVRATCIPEVTARISKQGTAQVLCPRSACKVTLQGRRGPLNIHATRTIAPGQIQSVRLSRRASRAIRGKRLRLRLLVGGERLTRRTITTK